MTEPSPQRFDLPVPAVPPPHTRDPLWFAPVFVLAPARSHSTVVTAMLGQHPQLYSFPELALFRAQTVAELVIDPPGWRGAPVTLRLAGLYRAIAELRFGGQSAETVTAAASWLAQRPAWTSADVFDHLLRLAAPSVGVEKSPENSSRDEWLRRMADAYPRARFLHLTRHPVPSVVSMHRVWHGRGYWDISDESFHHFCVGVWLHQHARVARFIAQLPPDRGLLVRAEDVLNSPAATLAGICRWLGVDADDTAVDAMCHPERSPFARVGPQGAILGGDPAFMEDARLRPAQAPESLEFPPEWGVEPWTALSAMALAASFGYGTPPASAASPPPRAAVRHPVRGVTETTAESAGLMTRLAVLGAAECEEIAARVRELRPHWSVRRWPGTATIGRAAYADAALGADADVEYHPNLQASNALLRAHFDDLLELVRERLARHLSEEVVFRPDVALPGFHIFEDAAIPVGLGGTPHFDLQHNYLSWPAPLERDGAGLLSFTLPIVLPAEGGGLDCWELTQENFTRAATHDPARSGQELIASTPRVQTRYDPGSLYLHTRMVLHRIAGVARRHEGDQRISLQGHGVRLDGRWILYW
jgi:Sulfotransferase family